MKHARNIAGALALAILIGCATTSTTIYKSLASVQVATSGAYNAYLDLVIQGKLTTNSVPVVSRDYTVFMATWSAAVAIASVGVSTPPPPAVTASAAKVLSDIAVVKGGGAL